jgi:hypothetical protein
MSFTSSSSASSGNSINLASYQESLESILAWLLEAEETLISQGGVLDEDDVQKAKEQFQIHEVCEVDCDPLVVMAWPETLRDESLPANFVGFPEWVFPI